MNTELPFFRALFSNDTTNIVSCVSPYHQQGERFQAAMLEASVDETANTGIDVHMFQPGVTVVPWWKSNQYPYRQHIEWYESTYKVKVSDNLYVQYMLEGGDMVEVFVARCRKKGLTPFISLRMNDAHGKEFVNGAAKSEIPEIPGFAVHCLNRFYYEHPEYRIDPNPGKENWSTRVLNWAIRPVRDWMFGFIEEICEGYDIGGLELDFMRHPNYFRLEETPLEERRAIMTEFVGRVRKLLDRTTPPGGRRFLGARLPCYLEAYDVIGMDLNALEAAGLDMVNVSPFYYTVQQTDFARLRKSAPNAMFYLEQCHTNEMGPHIRAGYDTFQYRRTTPQQYYTTSYYAYCRGAAGVSLFNFAYYRRHGADEAGPFSEPPFHAFKGMSDRPWLATQPQHWILTPGWSDPFRQYHPLPWGANPGGKRTFTLDLAPPLGGWKNRGRLRIQASGDLGTSKWFAAINGHELVETADRSEPYENPYPSMLETPAQYRAWWVPAPLLLDGENEVTIARPYEDNAYTIHYLDLAI